MKVKKKTTHTKDTSAQRRIHKIMKGHNNKEAQDGYNNFDIVKEYLLKIKMFIMNNRIVIKIKQNCDLDMKQIRFIITHLRIIFFDHLRHKQKNSILNLNSIHFILTL